MAYPTPSAYQEAVQFPSDAFADEALQEARPEENALGLPQPITGAFAAVFPMHGRAATWAVKCFLAGVPERRRRYRAIARHLEEAALPYTVGFDYQAEGIRVGGEAFPLLKMEWVEGVPLNRFVREHLQAPDVLAALAEEWAAMLEALEAAGVAHGDLQHGNVLVTAEGGALGLKLVDYDTMYVPALKGRGSLEVGHRNYQHPDRDEADFGPHLDRFAGLVVGAALAVCRRRPELWGRYDTDENMLFRAADFYDPSASPLFAELGEGALVEALRAACYLEPAAVPALAEVRAGAAALPVGAEAAARRRRARKEGAARSVFARWFLPAAVSIGAAAGVLVLSGWVGAGLVFLVLGAVAGGWAAARRYRRLPLVRRRRRLRQEAAAFETVIGNLERQVRALEEQHREVRATVGERRAERLRELQEEALYDRLKYHFIQEVGAVEGLSHKTVVRLKASGIRTAYEATPERLRGIVQLGEKSKARIALWRASLVARYEDVIPNELSPAEARRVERYVAHRIENLDAQIRRVQAKIRAQEHERAEVQARAEAMPPLTPGRYLRYLLRLDTLPAPDRPPAPPPPAAHAPAPDPQREASRWEQQAG